MLHGLFTVYDSKAKAYSLPFCAPTDDAAIRMFTKACRSPEGSWGEFPEDYCLFKIGEFADEDAELLPSAGPISIIGAWEIDQRPLVKETTPVAADVTKINADMVGQLMKEAN